LGGGRSGAGSPFNTMWPGPMPTANPSGILHTILLYCLPHVMGYKDLHL